MQIPLLCVADAVGVAAADADVAAVVAAAAGVAEVEVAVVGVALGVVFTTLDEAADVVDDAA